MYVHTSSAVKVVGLKSVFHFCEPVCTTVWKTSTFYFYCHLVCLYGLLGNSSFLCIPGSVFLVDTVQVGPGPVNSKMKYIAVMHYGCGLHCWKNCEPRHQHLWHFHLFGILVITSSGSQGLKMAADIPVHTRTITCYMYVHTSSAVKGLVLR